VGFGFLKGFPSKTAHHCEILNFVERLYAGHKAASSVPKISFRLPNLIDGLSECDNRFLGALRFLGSGPNNLIVSGGLERFKLPNCGSSISNRYRLSEAQMERLRPYFPKAKACHVSMTDGSQSYPIGFGSMAQNYNRSPHRKLPDEMKTRPLLVQTQNLEVPRGRGSDDAAVRTVADSCRARL